MPRGNGLRGELEKVLGHTWLQGLSIAASLLLPPNVGCSLQSGGGLSVMNGCGDQRSDRCGGSATVERGSIDNLMCALLASVPIQLSVKMGVLLLPSPGAGSFGLSLLHV